MEAAELAFKKEALEHGLAHIAIQNKDAMVELMLNIDETWRAKNEKSFFETELDKVDNGWGKVGCRIPIGNKKGEVFLAPVDSITDHVVVKSTMVSLSEELENKLVEALQFGAMSMTQIAEIRRKKMKDVSDIKAEIVYVDSFLRKRKLKGVDTDKPVERWKPEINEWYWKLRDTGVPLELKWTGTKQDWDYYHYGNCFRTNAEAVSARDMVKKALLG